MPVGCEAHTPVARRMPPAAHGATDRLAWTLARGPHVLAIPGTGNPAHLAENVAAGALRLTAEELDGLNEAHTSAG
ncbi:hypothetical protein GCM10010350_71340 [Streptomyces galilaeus]|nr:hypothetical protein GCM10010350_71340 [Streptomyces galilaeus]